MLSRWHPFNKTAACIIISLWFQPWCLASNATITPSGTQTPDSAEALQAAQILGIEREVDELVGAQHDKGFSESERRESAPLRAYIFRKIFRAVLQLRADENRLLAEIAYTNDVTTREQRREDDVQQVFNIANFSQFGVLYSLEGQSRWHKQFTQSSVLTGVSAGLGVGLPMIGIIYGKFAKAKNVAPPKYFTAEVNGAPVDDSTLSPLVRAYLDSPEPGCNQTRKDELYSFWKNYYHADVSKKETLCGINDGKPKGLFLLHKRITLLWSLYTKVQGFDRELLALLNQIKVQPASMLTPSQTLPAGMSFGAAQAAHLLQVEPLVSELASLKGIDNERKSELEMALLENILSAHLDVRTAEDQAQVEVNRQNDIVLSEMQASRNQFLQRTFEANFMQTGVLGAIATLLYLKGEAKAGNQLFTVAGGLGSFLSTASFLGMHGGWRKEDGDPNQLANFFDLKVHSKFPFSPLVWSYLHAPSAYNPDGRSPKDYLMYIWQKHRSVSVDLKNDKVLTKLAAAYKGKYDTIKLVENRVALLIGLRVQLEQFDSELLDLLRAACPAAPRTELARQQTELSVDKSALAAAELLGVQGFWGATTRGHANSATAKMYVTRDILDAFLETNSICAKISRQVVIEQQALGRMTRARDRVIQLTNIANFQQINVFDILIDGWLLNSADPRYVLAGNRITILSGIMAPCMAALTVLEQHGGIRPTSSEPNLLGEILGQPPPAGIQLPPLLVKYLDTAPPMSPTNITRREELRKYWTESHNLSVNVNRVSTVQKLSGYGKAHHRYSETINLMNNRVIMLSDLISVLHSSNIGFESLLTSIN